MAGRVLPAFLSCRDRDMRSAQSLHRRDLFSEGDVGMFGGEPLSVEDSLARTGRVCKTISLLMKVVFVLLCAWWLASASVMAFSLIVPGFYDYAVTLPFFLVYIASSAAMATVCVTLIKVFSDASKGRSPFTMLQVRRLRVVSAFFLVYAVLEVVLTSVVPFMAGGVDEGFVPTLNLFPFVASAVIFAFSFVFKYGVLLQEFSDETI